MGDSKRFSVLASYIAQNYPKYIKICDCAAGKGTLQVELNLRGFTNVISFDDRHWSKRESGILYQKKWIQETDEQFDLLVGLHPDSATDEIIKKASELKSNFLIVPCCSIPSAFPFLGGGFNSWTHHLECLAQNLDFETKRFKLPMKGRNLLLRGTYAQL